jgi:hypothetical protein
MELADSCLGIKGRQAQAREAFVSASELLAKIVATDPTDGPSWMALALTQAKTGQNELGLKSVRTADRNYAGDLDSQMIKVRTLELLGLRDESLATLQSCLERNAGLFQFKWMPDLERLRADSRFDQMASRFGASAATS